MSGLKIALLTLVSNLRSDAEAHGKDIRHPRVVLENRASDAYRIVEALDKAESTPVASRERIGAAVEAGVVSIDVAKYFLPGDLDRIIDALLAAGVFRDEATVKAEALRDAAKVWGSEDRVVIEALLFRADEIEAGDRS